MSYELIISRTFCCLWMWNLLWLKYPSETDEHFVLLHSFCQLSSMMKTLLSDRATSIGSAAPYPNFGGNQKESVSLNTVP